MIKSSQSVNVISLILGAGTHVVNLIEGETGSISFGNGISATNVLREARTELSRIIGKGTATIAKCEAVEKALTALPGLVDRMPTDVKDAYEKAKNSTAQAKSDLAQMKEELICIDNVLKFAERFDIEQQAEASNPTSATTDTEIDVDSLVASVLENLLGKGGVKFNALDDEPALASIIGCGEPGCTSCGGNKRTDIDLANLFNFDRKTEGGIRESDLPKNLPPVLREAIKSGRMRIVEIGGPRETDEVKTSKGIELPAGLGEVLSQVLGNAFRKAS